MVCDKKEKIKDMDIIILGRIEFDEFVEAVGDSYYKKFSRAEILEAFRRFDHNRDGFIEADELKSILSRLGRNFSNEEVVNHLFY
jgi:Ca2+-binding EF-hand superfamily protein